MTAVKPKFAFPTHNALLSDIGASIHDRLLQTTAAQIGCQYQPLAIGEAISIDEA
jgi:hypothetical protein